MCSAWTAVPVAGLCRLVRAKVSVQVASHATFLPFSNDIVVHTSGRRFAVWVNPRGSRMDGILAVSSDRFKSWFRLVCLGILPALRSQDTPCRPYESICSLLQL